MAVRGGRRGSGGTPRGVPHDPSFGPRYFGATSHFFVTSLAKRVSWTALPAGGREVRLPRHLDRAELSAGDPDDAHSGHPAPLPPPGGYEESVRGPMRSSGAGTWFALTEPQCWWRPWQRCRLGAELTRGPQSPFLCLTDLFIQSECVILSLLSSRYCALNWESRKSGVVLSPEELAVSPRCRGCPLGVRSQGPAGLGKLKTYDKIHARAGRDRHFRVS